MKNKSFKVNMKDYLPKIIIPRKGGLKPLIINEKGEFLELSYQNSRKDISLNKLISLSDDDFHAIGLYLAEGEIYVNPQNKIHHSGTVSFANSNVNCINIVCRLLEKFGVKRNILSWRIDLNNNFIHRVSLEELKNHWIQNIKINRNKHMINWLRSTGIKNGIISNNSSKFGCLQINYYSTLLRSIFIDFVFGIFDSCIKNRDKDRLALILSGFFAGDGNVNFNQKAFRREVGFIVHKKDLFDRIKTSLKILGLKRIKETYPERTKTHSKAIRIYNKEDFKILQKYEIPNLLNYKRDKFVEMMNSYAGVAKPE